MEIKNNGKLMLPEFIDPLQEQHALNSCSHTLHYLQIIAKDHEERKNVLSANWSKEEKDQREEEVKKQIKLKENIIKEARKNPKWV